MLYDWANPSENNGAIYVIYFIFGLVSILNIYVHFEYCFVNAGVTLLYDKERQVMLYKRKHKEDVVILPETIKELEIHQSRFYMKKGGFLTTDNYRYYKFLLNDDKVVVVTSLLFPNLDYQVDGKTVVKEMMVALVLIQ